MRVGQPAFSIVSTIPTTSPEAAAVRAAKGVAGVMDAYPSGNKQLKVFLGHNSPSIEMKVLIAVKAAAPDFNVVFEVLGPPIF